MTGRGSVRDRNPSAVAAVAATTAAAGSTAGSAAVIYIYNKPDSRILVLYYTPVFSILFLFFFFPNPLPTLSTTTTTCCPDRSMHANRIPRYDPRRSRHRRIIFSRITIIDETRGHVNGRSGGFSPSSFRRSPYGPPSTTATSITIRRRDFAIL